MHVIKIPEGISEPVVTYQGLPLRSGKEYICTNAFAGQMLTTRWRVIINGDMWALRLLIKAHNIAVDPFDPTKDWNDKDIWLNRAGGWGDLLMMTPLIREMKSLWPDSRIHIACGGQYHSLFDEMDVITELLPIPTDLLLNIHALVDFEDIVEGDPAAISLHIAELFASRAGITLKDLKPEYHVTPDEKAWALYEYPRNSRPRIGLQCMASAYYRTHPGMGKMMVQLSEKADVYMMGSPGQIKITGSNAHVHNLMDDKLDFRQNAAVVSTCDACLSPDSALVHLCAALDIPCVALYGPFPSELRVTSDRTFAFDGKAPCAPCFFHAEKPDEFPAGMPCSEKRRCVALESIDPNIVVQKTLSLAKAFESPG